MLAQVRGSDFEKTVKKMLELLMEHSDDQANVTVTCQPRITLQNGDLAIPDFELVYELDHQRSLLLLECQNRERWSPDIARKMRDIKRYSKYNRLIFVYKSEGFLPEVGRQSLESDGIRHYSLLEFAVFIEQLSRTLSPRRRFGLRREAKKAQTLLATEITKIVEDTSRPAPQPRTSLAPGLPGITVPGFLKPYTPVKTEEQQLEEKVDVSELMAKLTGNLLKPDTPVKAEEQQLEEKADLSELMAKLDRLRVEDLKQDEAMLVKPPPSDPFRRF